jgi:hypothetical protein
MTQAICIFCGTSKFGGFTECEKCHEQPKTDDELVLSLTLTDWNCTDEQLVQYGEVIASGGEVILPDDFKAEMLDGLKRRKTP